MVNLRYSFLCSLKGNLLLDQENFSEALACFKAALKFSKNKSEVYEAYFSIANCLCCLKKYEESIENYNIAIVVDPTEYGSYHNKGNVLFQTARYEHAVKCYEKCIELNPKIFVEYMLNGGTQNFLRLNRIGQTDKIYAMNSNIENFFIDYNFPPKMNMMQDLFGKLLSKNLAKHLEELNYKNIFERRFPLNITERLIYIQPGFLKYHSRASSNLHKARRFKSIFLPLYEYLNTYYSSVCFGSCEGALKACDEALRAYPFYLEAYNHKAICLILLKRFQDALVELDKVLKIDANYSSALYNKEIVLYFLKNFSQGATYLYQVQIYPKLFADMQKTDIF